MAIAVALLCAYLLGSIPFGLLIARLRRVDLRTVGSGNIGATNAARALGKGWGVLVLLLDAAKAAAPVYFCRRYFGRDPAHAELADWVAIAAAAAAFLGHLFPIFAGFRGGKGVATAFGSFLALEPVAAGLGFAVYAVAYAVTRISSVGSLLAVLSFPLWLYLTGARLPSFVLSGGLLIFIVVRHSGNIRRLLSREEGKV